MIFYRQKVERWGVLLIAGGLMLCLAKRESVFLNLLIATEAAGFVEFINGTIGYENYRRERMTGWLRGLREMRECIAQGEISKLKGLFFCYYDTEYSKTCHRFKNGKKAVALDSSFQLCLKAMEVRLNWITQDEALTDMDKAIAAMENVMQK